MKKLLALTVVIGLLACGMAFSVDWVNASDDDAPIMDELWTSGVALPEANDIGVGTFSDSGLGGLDYLNSGNTGFNGLGKGTIFAPAIAVAPARLAAVPEPATLLGFGVPMLMVGLGRLRNLRK